MRDYTTLPDYMQDAMRRYIDNGIEPGGFLTAVLSNELMGALRKADDINMNRLPTYARFLYNEAPCGCYGSPEKFRDWCKNRGLNGINADPEAVQ